MKLAQKPKIIAASRLKRPLKSADQLVDFRPGIDYVIHDPAHGGRCFVRDSQGLMADVEVESDLLTEADQIRWRKSCAALPRGTAADGINMRVRAVRGSPYLSTEGKQQRFTALRLGWRDIFGDAIFVVE